MVANDINIRRWAWLPVWGLLWMGQACAEEAAEEPRWYQVELIVFAHPADAAARSEHWPEIADLALPGILRRLSLPSPVATAAPAQEAFVLLGAEEFLLKDTAAKLARSRFEPLLHVAWRQPTLADEQTLPILLHDGMTAPYTEAEVAALRAQTAENTPIEPAPVAETDEAAGPPAHKLLGTVRLSVARYLHLDADLLYRLPITQKAAVPAPDSALEPDRFYPTLREPQGPAFVQEAQQTVQRFRLQESRRMRSKEIHYLDHPLFGVVALVTPLEKKD